MITAPMT